MDKTSGDNKLGHWCWILMKTGIAAEVMGADRDAAIEKHFDDNDGIMKNTSISVWT